MQWITVSASPMTAARFAFSIFRTQVYRDGGADTHANADSHGDNGILERISKRNRSKSVGSQSGHIDAVNDVV